MHSRSLHLPQRCDLRALASLSLGLANAPLHAQNPMRCFGLLWVITGIIRSQYYMSPCSRPNYTTTMDNAIRFGHDVCLLEYLELGNPNTRKIDY